MKQKFFFHKKAEASDTVVLWIIQIAFLISVIVFILSLLAIGRGEVSYGDRTLDAHLVADSLLYNPVLMHTDEKGTTLPGVVDLDQYKSRDSLSSSLTLPVNVNYIVFQINITQNDRVIETIYYKEAIYRSWKTAYEGGFVSGEGAYNRVVVKQPVVLYPSYTPAILTYDMFVPLG